MKTFFRITGGMICLMAAVFCIVYGHELEPGDGDRLWIQVIAGVCLACSFFCLLGDRETANIKKILKNMAERIILSISALFGMSRGKSFGNTKFIGEYSDTFYKVRKNENRKEPQKRYRDMDNKERIRFFYGKMIKKQIYKGYSFRYSATVNEIGEDLINKKRISEKSSIIFQFYNEARYNTRADITDENVERMKKITKKP